MINEVRIEGNLTKEPELKPAGNNSVVTFSIACDVRKKQGEEWITTDAEYYDVEFWPKDPQYWIKRLTKGTGVLIFGKLKQDRWEKDGSKFSRVKIVAQDIKSRWMPTIEEQQEMKAKTGAKTAETQTAGSPPADPSEDIPF